MESERALRFGLGLARGASVPKNGNNRPLSLPLENFSPPTTHPCPSFFLEQAATLWVFAASWIMSCCRLLPGCQEVCRALPLRLHPSQFHRDAPLTYFVAP